MKSFPFRIEFPPELPISARAGEITDAIQAHQVVIIAGETGSGKTTQLPKMCLAAGRGGVGRIACTQPRRVAALSISRRVAEELGVGWGREVGCKVRFLDQTSRPTIVKFVTDGMLLAELQGDPALAEYDTIIIDEAHERSLNIDFLIGHLRQLRHRRPELKIVITSATIDTAAFSAAFDGAPVIVVEGRTFPVEVIHAPLEELGRDYAEDDENEERVDVGAVVSARAEALHYIDGAVEAVQRILRESTTGDLLVFLPSERDIREVGDLLGGGGRESAGGRAAARSEVVPLFGRLTNAEQQRVFAPTPRRKIVLATNIAETSLTIPGIRYVVDTGLARVSRYAPLARTRRLPIEPISQASAEQRKGRAGRLTGGVCIRLYSEKDWLERPRFTQPEIQRANLAEVILRLQAYGLGEIERFPFINLPAAKAIHAGYALLEELGAMTETAAGAGSRRELTPLGRELARLPVDPTVGRMILQAREEKAVREVAVIAAGLSIQDPRERPLDRRKQADAAHRRFAHPDSDFLTLLNIWEAFHDEFEQMTQAKLRRFCREHFLSYPRMREWRDLHAQLLETLAEREDFRPSSVWRGERPGDEKSTRFGTPPYRAIHRSIVTGLLGNIARHDEEGGGYRATHDRRIALFPGSVLFRREDPSGRPKKAPERESDGRSARPPRWMVASEIVETVRLYARTCARIDPAWALELGAHVIRVAHSEPFWDAEGGRVLVKQRSRLHGLELECRAVGYGRIDPVRATEIFIREGLVGDTITFPLDFIAHNRAVRETIAERLTRARDSGFQNLDEAAYRFYAARLLPPNEVREIDGSGGAVPRARCTTSRAGELSDLAGGISTVAELVDLMRARRRAEPRFLMMAPADLRDPDTVAHDAAAFPEALPLSNGVLPLNYAYRPGQADDGVTLEVSVREAEVLTPAALDWAVPGHLGAKVEHYLRALPRELRRGFVPLAETARKLTAALAARDRAANPGQSLPEALAAEIAERLRVALDPAIWREKPPPEHLRVRVRVVDAEGRELAASRDLAEIRAALLTRSREASAVVAREDPAAWRAARDRWETAEATTWNFDPLPERVVVTERAGAPIHAFPGLCAGREGVARRLFRTPEDAVTATARGLAALFEHQLGRDLMWTQRDLRALRELGPLAVSLAPVEELQEQAFESIRRWVTRRKVVPLEGSAFAAALEGAKADLRGLVPRLVDLLREILSLRVAMLGMPDAPPAIAADLARLLPRDFLRTTPYAQLAHLPRYLKAIQLRCDRARKNPARDAARQDQLDPYVRALERLAATEPTGRESEPAAAAGGTKLPLLVPEKGDDVEAFRWLLEEFRVSLFAQELGTAEPVSTVRLERALAVLRGAREGTAGGEVPRPAPPPKKPVGTGSGGAKKAFRLKSLAALGQTLPR